jgi:ABC-2 type transport system ATP-binding protein
VADERVIRLTDLSRTFGDIIAVDGLSFSVERGEMFGLVGPDGAGKTTTLRMLCGILEPGGGAAEILGYDVVREPDRVKREIGYLSQRFSLYGDLTVDENIEFFAGINGITSFRERRDELLEFTRLTPFRRRLAENLSGGMKQKLALACTLIHTPRIIFLDEPTTGVDPVSRRDFWRILQSLRAEGITIVMSTPYLDEAERCTHVALMNAGRAMIVDTPGAIRERMRGEVVEIVCERVRDAARVLRNSTGAMEVQAFGDRLNVIVSDAAAGVPFLTGALRREGIAMTGWRVIAPSLENVFISLLTHSDHASVKS